MNDLRQPARVVLGCGLLTAAIGVGCPGPDTKSPVETGTEPGESGPAVDSSDTATHDSAQPIDSSDTGEPVPSVESVDSLLSVRDYGYLFWPGNHWYDWGTYENVQYFQTGYYALALDVTTGNLDHLGLIADAFGPEEALLQDNTVVTDLPEASVRYVVTLDGTDAAATGFAGSDGSTTNPSELIDMGRFMQRVEIPTLSYDGLADLSGSVQLAAMTRHFVLTHRATSTLGASSLTVSIELEGDAVSRYD
ncbi:MAG: hypothetical protein QGG40_18560, partial [Myxococcota bacterium]|nr:hypothetical protein [Myxococcota bacterium]